MQEFNASEINSAFVGFNIEMYFELSDIEGGQHSNWSNGVVTEIVNEKNKSVQENGTSHVCQRWWGSNSWETASKVMKSKSHKIEVLEAISVIEILIKYVFEVHWCVDTMRMYW